MYDPKPKFTPFKSGKKTIVNREAERKKLENKGKKPPIVKWRDSKMLRRHSLRATVDEVLRHSKQIDVTRISIIGKMGTGKSTLAKVIAHILHEKAKKLDPPIQYAVKIFTKKELGNFKETISRLDSNLNHILVFDDVSYMQNSMSRQQIMNIQSEMTTIRHMEGGKDRKITMILNFHMVKSVTPFLRDSDFSYFTTIGNSDLDNVVNTWQKGKEDTRKMKDFKLLAANATKYGKFFGIITKGPKKPTKLTYEFKNPFAPALFLSDATTRIIVFPKREWIDPHCAICDSADTSVEITEKDTDNLMAALEKSKFGKGNVMRGVTCLALLSGRNYYPDNVKRVIRFLERYNEKNPIDIDSLCKRLGMVEKQVKYRSCQTLPKGDDKDG